MPAPRAASQPPIRLAGWARQKAPYFAVLILAIFGVAYTSIAQKPLFGYWEFLGAAVGVACVAIGWRKTQDKRERYVIARTQLLHWAAFLVAMNIVLWPSVNTFLNGPSTGLALLLLLALGTFVAGVHVSRDIAVLGLALAAAVPAIAWFKQIALLLALGLLVLVAVGVTLWTRRDDAPPAA
ncbi:hypothetical protein K3F48_13000 [Methylosinus sp. Sm6]|nr:hypothetical protein [Methylosinus sp. Sm6]